MLARHPLSAALLLAALASSAVGCATSTAALADAPRIGVFVTAGNRVLVDGTQMEPSAAREAIVAFALANPGAVVELCASDRAEVAIREALKEEARGAVRQASALLAADGNGSVDLPNAVAPPHIDESSCL